MSPETAILVEDVSKKFARSLKKAMVYGLIDIARAALIPHRFRSEGLAGRLADAAAAPAPVQAVSDSELRASEFWALRNVSLEVKRGECVGLIGGNGAGKSTLFSILSGIYGPTRGRVSLRGRFQALIALGAGFHPMLSGRENVYINAAVLGLTSKEIDPLMERIIDFAGIGAFIDAPVKMYSSGMLVRLGFAVAAHMDPDILLVDEVLAVGDAAFQQKCQEFSLNLIHSGKTIMIVAHNMLTIQAMCNRVVWLDKGRIVQQGETTSVVRDYKRFMAAQWSRASLEGEAPAGGRPAMITDVKIIQRGKPIEKELIAGEPARVEIPIVCNMDIRCARVWMHFATVERDFPIVGASMYNDGHHLYLKRGLNRVVVEFDPLPLMPGFSYRLYIGIRDLACYSMLADSYSSSILEVSEAYVPCRNGIGQTRMIGMANSAAAVPYIWKVDGGAVLHSHDVLTNNLCKSSVPETNDDEFAKAE